MDVNAARVQELTAKLKSHNWKFIRKNAEMETAFRACLQMQRLAFYRDVVF
jgi:hypothetical protein